AARVQFFRSLLDLQYIFSSAFFCLKLDNFFQISSFLSLKTKLMLYYAPYKIGDLYFCGVVGSV
ncbi:MAG: hypothetical protein O9304_03005, partial [Microcystis sp. LE19-114.1B]|nr:hypothetical protein [Microcystis sp. LE19-114.1B]